MSRCGTWRSLLFVPADAEQMLTRAHLRGADGLILDLEDGVAAGAKQEARRTLDGAIASLADKAVDVLVRINQGWRDVLADLSVAVQAGVVALVVPKTEDAAKLTVISEMIHEFESERGLVLGRIGLVALIESPLGLARAVEIAAAPRVAALALGPEDFCLSLGVLPTPESLDLPCRTLALAAATRQLQCLAMPISIAAIQDTEGFASAADRSAAVGCTGALCVHPLQVRIANDRFVPTSKALKQAEGVVKEWERAQADGRAVAQLDGMMIDKPVAERARRLLRHRSSR